MNDDVLKARQKYLFSKLNQEYYHKVDISRILNVSLEQVEKIVEDLDCHAYKGYYRLDIVLKLMGGFIIGV